MPIWQNNYTQGKVFCFSTGIWSINPKTINLAGIISSFMESVKLPLLQNTYLDLPVAKMGTSLEMFASEA